MSNIWISKYRIKRPWNALHTQVENSYFCATRSRVQAGGTLQALTGSFLNLRRLLKQTVQGFLYASLVALTGCATSAEIESLRAEVAKANAVASRAEVEVSETRRELAAMKKASGTSEPLSKPSSPPAINSNNTSGYKWGELQHE